MSFLEQLYLVRFGWRDVLELLIIGYAIYRVLLLLQRSRAVPVLFGVVVLLLTYATAALLKLTMITYVLTQLYTYGAFALLIIFAPELRAALAHLGRSPMTRFLSRMEASEVAEQIAEAVERLSRTGIGAIVAVERDVPLDEYIHSGSEMRAKVSADLMATIFTPYSPLHDGAVIVRGDDIVAAGCILPLSQASELDRSLGTRHRAALGLSEESDAVVIVVSEETATISAAVQGRLWRNLSSSQVREVLAGELPRQLAEGRARAGAGA